MPQAHALVGLECGGTRSVALAATPGLELIRRIEAGPANLRLVSDSRLQEHFAGIAAQLPAPAAIGIGMAGVRDGQDITRVLAVAERVWPGVPAIADHDLESALSAADLDLPDPARPKVIILSGTGSCCYGRAPSGRTAKVGGWGHQIGDRGSAYDIVHRALRAAAHHLDHTGRWCRFGQRALRATLLNQPNDLIAWMQAAAKSDVAALAPEVFAAAAEGDRVARDIVEETVRLLADDALACARRLGRRPSDFILAGSVVLRQEALATRIARRIRRELPGSRIVPLERESAWGAVAMARRIQLEPASRTATTPSHPTSPAPARETCPIPSSARLSPTEQRNPASRRLDRMALEKAIDLMLAEEATLPAIIRSRRVDLARLIRRTTNALSGGGRLIYVGAGTSGRLGVLDASECPPTFRTPPEWVQGIIAGGTRALHSAVEGAEDDPEAGAQAVRERGVAPRDVVLGIAASGRTPFVWGALHAARQAGAFTALLCFNPHLVLDRHGPPDLLLDFDAGPEILTGSTRLKAGTATKLVLNLITTLTMVRLGKVVGNLMVDLNPSNTKLRDRAARIVHELTGATPDAARAALEHEAWNVKAAARRLGVRR